MEKTFAIVPGMKTAVVGFGRAGQSLVRYLSSEGADVLVSDFRMSEELNADERLLLKSCSVTYEGGAHTAEFLKQVELIIVSPGVPLDIPALCQARQQGVAVIGELALAAGKFQAPVIAISGTNGKTTVTELTGQLLRKAGKRVFVGGNIGTPVGDYLLEPEGYDFVVLEVSSFQLELCGAFAADVGVLLNITPDHLDRHGTLEAYAAVKMKLFQNKHKTRHGVINGEDPVIGRHLHRSLLDSFQLFGYDTSCDASIIGNTIRLNSDTPPKSFDLSGSSLDTVTGRMNCAAALLAVRPFELDQDRLLDALLGYVPGKHRLQDLGEIEGVRYIDDSKATNSGAVSKGLEQVGGRIILIAGGKEKGDDFCQLRCSVEKYVKKLILIGEAAGKISSILGDLAPVGFAETMDEAVMMAASAAERGDRVLLSPACASFDMFDNYIHRGQAFEKAVNTLRNRTVAEMME